jgi:hypothetical protein
MAARSKVRQTIRARKKPAGGFRNTRAVRSDVRSLIMKEFVIDPKQVPFLIDRRPDSMPLLTRMIRGNHVLSAIL